MGGGRTVLRGEQRHRQAADRDPEEKGLHEFLHIPRRPVFLFCDTIGRGIFIRLIRLRPRQLDSNTGLRPQPCSSFRLRCGPQ
jgi:hypothetical protein